jgi:hypothetical protein
MSQQIQGVQVDDDGTVVSTPREVATDDKGRFRMVVRSAVHCTWQVSVTTSITPLVPAWASGTAYLIGEVVTNDSGKMYRCSVAGTSAGSGGPTGTDASAITDNTATWLYVSGFVNGFLVTNMDGSNAVFLAQHGALTTSKASGGIPAGAFKPYPYANPSLWSARAGATVVVTVEAAL